MITKVQKWGNRLAVRIPQAVAKDMQLHSGETVDLVSHDGQITIAPVRRQRYKLSALLKDVTPKNRHAEIVTDAGKWKGLGTGFDSCS